MSSKSDDVLAAAVSALGNVTWSPSPAATFAVEARKTLTAVKKGETCVIVVARDGKERVERIYAGKVVVTYPWAIAFGVKTAAMTGDTTQTNWRQQGSTALLARSTWTGLTGWNGTSERQDGVVYDENALGDGWIWSAMGFETEVLEDRT